MSQPNTSQSKICEKHVSDKEKRAMMKKIEKTTEKVVEKCIETGHIVSPFNADPKKADDSSNLLVGIMNVGAGVFQDKMGRPMTYGEMREMFG